MTLFLTFVYLFIAIDDSTLPSRGLLSANVSILLKSGKDPSQCSSYRSITLLNMKVLANRLSPLIPAALHRDQVGFVPGREARDNTIKTTHLISYIQCHKLKACLLSFDAEKAFDRVSWRFLRLFLEQLGLGASFISKVVSLYSQPSAFVLVNGTSSDPFDISMASELSPLPRLCVIVIEHLACTIRHWLLFRVFKHPPPIINYPYMLTTFWSTFNNPPPH